MANLAWGIEGIVEGPSGRTIDRRQFFAERQPSAPAPTSARKDTFIWRLSNERTGLLDTTDPGADRSCERRDRVPPRGHTPAGRLAQYSIGAKPRVDAGSTRKARHIRRRDPARGRTRHARLPLRALVQRRPASMDRPPQTPRPRRRIERSKIRHRKEITRNELPIIAKKRTNSRTF